MSVPSPRRRKPSPQQITAAWGIAFEAVRDELIRRGIEDNKASEIAAQVAAELAKESDLGNQPRNN
jgi:hypothetical protein